MATKKFPNLIHVTRENTGTQDEYLSVAEGGVFSLNEPAPVAIYKLVEVGRVQILKSFQSAKKSKRR